MSTLRVNNILDSSGGDLVNSRGIAKAWVNFNGEGTIAIRSSMNVTSLTDNGVGDYSVNFATALADANYSAVGLAARVAASDDSFPTSVGLSRSSTSSSARFRLRNAFSAAVEDVNSLCVAIYR